MKKSIQVSILVRIIKKTKSRKNLKRKKSIKSD